MSNPIDIAIELCTAFSSHRIDHAIGGAIALGFHAEPRGTIDLDINVFITEETLSSFLDVLGQCGYTVDREAAALSVRERGDFRLQKGECRVDFFVSFHPFHDQVRDRVEWGELRGVRIPILSAEDLIVFKVLFSRPKDWVDLTNLVAAKGPGLDRDYLQRWLGELLPDGDERMDRIVGLMEEFGQPR